LYYIDASRKLLSDGEFSNATAVNSILLLSEALVRVDLTVISVSENVSVTMGASFMVSE